MCALSSGALLSGPQRYIRCKPSFFAELYCGNCSHNELFHREDEAMMELRWVERFEPLYPGHDVGHSVKHLQFRLREGPKGDDWWGDWKDVPVEKEF
jgi:hypothetical protein